MYDRLATLGLGLEHRLHDRVSLLSAGQRQSLTMVMAGLQTPQLLLLDEHLTALDPKTAARCFNSPPTL
jgi:putative tryptophan/tyrosine transport system ATP-binding protein